jgi:nucleoside-diphosphate-sugar epimerase
MIKLIRRGWAPLPGSPEAYFSSVSHDDAATAVLAALELPPGAFNVVDGEPLRRREFAATLAIALGAASPKMLPAWLTRLGGSFGEFLSRSQCISNQKLRAAGHWAPKYPSVRAGWPAALDALL